ncbi:MAG TPA: hypothetical protein VEA19_07545 [Actinomycetota bacterium]|nr:hypothetical protein [Actinomycetota bacterium]
MAEKTRATIAAERRNALRGPRCVANGRAEMTDVCADIKTLSQMLLLCERRFANSMAAGDPDKAGGWANAGEAVLTALRSKSS